MPSIIGIYYYNIRPYILCVLVYALSPVLFPTIVHLDGTPPILPHNSLYPTTLDTPPQPPYR
jgi:hypothetical protein